MAHPDGGGSKEAWHSPNKGLCKKKRKLDFIAYINFYNHLMNFIEFALNAIVLKKFFLRNIFVHSSELSPRLNPECAVEGS